MLTITQDQYETLIKRVERFLIENKMKEAQSAVFVNTDVHDRTLLKELFKRFVNTFNLKQKRITEDYAWYYTRFMVEGEGNTKTDFFQIIAKTEESSHSRKLNPFGITTMFDIERITLTDGGHWKDTRVIRGYSILYYRDERISKGVLV